MLTSNTVIIQVYLYAEQAGKRDETKIISAIYHLSTVQQYQFAETPRLTWTYSFSWTNSYLERSQANTRERCHKRARRYGVGNPEIGLDRWRIESSLG